MSKITRDKKGQIKIFETDVTEACDDFIEAHKIAKDASDRLEVTRSFLAGVLKKHGIMNLEQIRHENKIITLKEGKVTEDSVSIKDAKD